MTLKRKIFFNMKNNIIHKVVIFIYNFIFKRETREHKIKCGNKNPDKVFYVIRPRGDMEGILSCLRYVSIKIDYAYKNNYIPVVDFKNYKSQYEKVINEYEKNPWNIFFNQVEHVSLEEVYNSKNVYLSGWKLQDFFKKEDESIFITTTKYKEIVQKIGINKIILDNVNKLEDEIIQKKTLGVFIRGTDYISLKPVGHYIQPTIDELTNKIMESIENNKIEDIFLVTEDKKIEDELRKRINIPIKTLELTSKIEYTGNNYLSYSIQSKDIYDITTNYLERILLLSRCDYIISSITNATFFLLSIKETEYKNAYFFDLGKY